MKLSRLVTVFTLSAAAGWVIENALAPGEQRFSSAFGLHLPLLPVYGAGGVAMALAAPRVRGLPLIARAALYGAALTAVEFAACRLDGATLWNYARDDGAASPCVDLPHSLAWTAAALVVEPLFAGR